MAMNLFVVVVHAWFVGFEYYKNDIKNLSDNKIFDLLYLMLDDDIVF